MELFFSVWYNQSNATVVRMITVFSDASLSLLLTLYQHEQWLSHGGWVTVSVIDLFMWACMFATVGASPCVSAGACLSLGARCWNSASANEGIFRAVMWLCDVKERGREGKQRYRDRPRCNLAPQLIHAVHREKLRWRDTHPRSHAFFLLRL